MLLGKLLALTNSKQRTFRECTIGGGVYDELQGCTIQTFNSIQKLYIILAIILVVLL